MPTLNRWWAWRPLRPRKPVHPVLVPPCHWPTIENETNQNPRTANLTETGFSSTVDDGDRSVSSRSNSGANQGSMSHMAHVSSPKTPSIISQQSPSVLSTSKPILPSAVSSASALSTSAPPQFAYPVTSTTAVGTLPVLQYATIVSQNTVLSTTTPSTPKQSPHILSPAAKQQSKAMSNGTSNPATSNDATVMTTSALPLASVTSSSTNSHPPSLLSSTNNLLESSSSIESNSASLLARDNDRPFSSMMSNGSSDGHATGENSFPTMPSTSSSSFLPNSNSNMGELSAPSTTNGGVIGQLAGGIPINPDHHPVRFTTSSSTASLLHQQPIVTGRVQLTPAETRMLNRLNSAYTKLPSLLESERQR